VQPASITTGERHATANRATPQVAPTWNWGIPARGVTVMTPTAPGVHPLTKEEERDMTAEEIEDWNQTCSLYAD